MQKLIVGHGYVGQYLSKLLTSRSIEHAVASRSAAPSADLLPLQQTLTLDLDTQIEPLAHNHIWYFAPPNKNELTDVRVKHFLHSLSKSTAKRRLVYISTTGVYGNCDGDWVTETSPLAPVSNRAKRRVDAEQQIREWGNRDGNEFVILRVAGIYGPNRLPIARLKSNAPMLSESDAPWSNRIHIDDLVSICFEAMSSDGQKLVYNVADSEPSNMAHYFNQVADISGLPRPKVVNLEEDRGAFSEGMLSYLTESRRIDNKMVLAELGVKLKYPGLGTGLPAAWANSTIYARRSSEVNATTT